MPNKSKDQYLFKAALTCRLPTWSTRTTMSLRFLMKSKDGSAAWKKAVRIAKSYAKARDWDAPQVESVKLVCKIDRIKEKTND